MARMKLQGNTNEKLFLKLGYLENADPMPIFLIAHH